MADDDASFDPDEVLADIEAGEYLPRTEQLRRLSAEGHERADWLVAANAAALAAQLPALMPQEPVCALCLMQTEDVLIEDEERAAGTPVDGVFSVGDVCVETARGRERELARWSPEDVRVGAWAGPHFYGHAYRLAPSIRTTEFRQIEASFAAEANELDGVPKTGADPVALMEWSGWPWSWIFERVAQWLNAEPPLPAITDDFVAFFQDGDFFPEPEILIPRVARPEAVALLWERGLLEQE